jgi:hypothetical protein
VKNKRLVRLEGKYLSVRVLAIAKVHSIKTLGKLEDLLSSNERVKSFGGYVSTKSPLKEILEFKESL